MIPNWLNFTRTRPNWRPISFEAQPHSSGKLSSALFYR